jgi:hypothetical protein
MDSNLILVFPASAKRVSSRACNQHTFHGLNADCRLLSADRHRAIFAIGS